MELIPVILNIFHNTTCFLIVLSPTDFSFSFSLKTVNQNLAKFVNGYAIPHDMFLGFAGIGAGLLIGILFIL